MVISKKSIPRRAFLRGSGAALALPLLDAMTPAFAVEKARPTRMAFMEVPNGIMNLNGELTPKAVGTDFELTSRSAATIRAPARPGSRERTPR